MVILAFMRISTNRRVFERPLSMKERVHRVQSWLDRPNVRIVRPSCRRCAPRGSGDRAWTRTLFHGLGFLKIPQTEVGESAEGVSGRQALVLAQAVTKAVGVVEDTALVAWTALTAIASIISPGSIATGNHGCSAAP